MDGVEPLQKHTHSSINFFCRFQDKLYSVQEHSNSWGSYSQGKEQRLAIIYSVGERERKVGRMEVMQLGEGETAAGIARSALTLEIFVVVVSSIRKILSTLLQWSAPLACPFPKLTIVPPFPKAHFLFVESRAPTTTCYPNSKLPSPCPPYRSFTLLCKETTVTSEVSPPKPHPKNLTCDLWG